MDKRSFLLLQGVASPFFFYLARRLRADGHAVRQVAFNGGDWLYSGWHGCRHFRRSVENLPAFYESLWRQGAITDQVMFGDMRPVHRAAIRCAERYGVRTHVFEEGYFRPWWVTLEREGVNLHSSFPRDPDWFREAGRDLPVTKPHHFQAPFRVRATHDVIYHLAGVLNPVFYPGYRTHSLYTAPLQYPAYLWRFSRMPHWRRRDGLHITRLIASGRDFFVLPLQLDWDVQVRFHSPFKDMQEAMAQVMDSFARNAPGDSVLVIKNHPLDMGWARHGRAAIRQARALGVADRVCFFESGDLALLLRHAQGMVTVNSTSGILALEMGCPTIALAEPIYNLPGLSFQGPLAQFWREGAPADQNLFNAFRAVVLHAAQINGGFYCREGIAIAVEGAARVLGAAESPLEALLRQTGRPGTFDGAA